jgi:hypothetical protein
VQITLRIRNQSHGPQDLPPFIRATQLSNVILPALREGSPRRIWACRLHCEHRMVTSGALSGMCKVLLLSGWAVASWSPPPGHCTSPAEQC